MAIEYEWFGAPYFKILDNKKDNCFSIYLITVKIKVFDKDEIKEMTIELIQIFNKFF